MPRVLGSFLGLWHPTAEIMGPQNLGYRTEGLQRSCVAQSKAPKVLGISRRPGQPRSPTPFLMGSGNRRNRNLQSTEAEKEQSGLSNGRFMRQSRPSMDNGLAMRPWQLS